MTDGSTWKRWDGISVVIPHFESPSPLRVVLRGLAAQSIPVDAFEVVVADDGSQTALRPETEDESSLRVTVVMHERKGARRGTVRNLGVAHSTGELVVFLDADMVPDRGWLAAHASSHAELSNTVVLGDRLHVDSGCLTPDGLDVVLAQQTGLRRFAQSQGATRPEWRSSLIRETDELRAPGSRPWRVAGGGNLSTTRAQFDSVGGFSDEFDGWGGEDLEFAYRLFISGAQFIWDPAAFAVHLGLQATPSTTERAQLRRQERLIADRIADVSLRAHQPPRVWSVPRAVISIDEEVAASSNVADTIDAVLCSGYDVGVVLDIGKLDTTVRRSYEAEQRVKLEPEPPTWRWSPVRGVIHATGATAATIASAIALVTPESQSGFGEVVITNEDASSATLVSVPMKNSSYPMSRFELASERVLTNPQSFEYVDDLQMQRIRNAFWRLGPRQRRLLGQVIGVFEKALTLRSRVRSRIARRD